MVQSRVLGFALIFSVAALVFAAARCEPCAQAEEPKQPSAAPAAKVPASETKSIQPAAQLPAANQPRARRARPEWAIVLHGGAGRPPENLSPEELAAYKKRITTSLTEALKVGRGVLEEGGASLDAVEQVVRYLEDSPEYNAGRGSVLNIEGGFEMHASIMSGKDRACGAVAAVDTIKNPITAARLVMTKTDFILLVGEGAERFAAEAKAEIVKPEYFRTDRRVKNWQEAVKLLKEGMPEKADGVGTVGCVALDKFGNLAAATSTGGVAHKRFGRMGDSSIIGAGNYADNNSCAVSCTGRGEAFIRNTVAFRVSALMQYKELSLREAVEQVIDRRLPEGSGGLIAIDKDGNIVMDFNRGGMRRAAADANGRHEVHYWE